MKFKRGFVLLLFLILILNSCEAQRQNFKQKWHDIKENFTETIKVSLSHFPILKNYVTLFPPPKELYEEMQLTLSQLEAYKAHEIYPEEWTKLSEEWGEIQKFYQERRYLKAQKLLKNTMPRAKALLEKTQKYYSELKQSALNQYNEVKNLVQEKMKKASSEEKLKMQLYLWKLKNLITLGKYEEFKRELEKRPF